MELTQVKVEKINIYLCVEFHGIVFLSETSVSRDAVESGRMFAICGEFRFHFSFSTI